MEEGLAALRNIWDQISARLKEFIRRERDTETSGASRSRSLRTSMRAAAPRFSERPDALRVLLELPHFTKTGL